MREEGVLYTYRNPAECLSLAGPKHCGTQYDLTLPDLNKKNKKCKTFFVSKVPELVHNSIFKIRIINRSHYFILGLKFKLHKKQEL